MRMVVWSPGQSSLQFKHLLQLNSLLCSSGTSANCCLCFLSMKRIVDSFLCFTSYYYYSQMSPTSLYDFLYRFKVKTGESPPSPSKHIKKHCILVWFGHQYLFSHSVCDRSCLQSGITIEWRKPTTFGDAEIDYYQLMVCFNVFFTK